MIVKKTTVKKETPKSDSTRLISLKFDPDVLQTIREIANLENMTVQDFMKAAIMQKVRTGIRKLKAGTKKSSSVKK